MFKKDKKLMVTLILMFVIVACLILIVCLYENKIDNYESSNKNAYKSLQDVSESYSSLKEENASLADDIENLEKENIKLKEDNSKLTTYQQSLNILKDISDNIAQGNKNEAKEALQNLDPSGFDPTALAFYESLCRELNITN